MRKPPAPVASTDLSGSLEISMSRAGRSTSPFIRSIRLVPPAMNLAPGPAAIWRTASATSLARAYSKLIMACHPSRPSPAGRRHDVGIGAAAAEVAAHQLADFVAGPGLPLRDQAGRRADLSRRAIAALEGVVLDEGVLQGVQGAILGQPLDGRDMRAILHDGKRQAGIDAPAVDQDGASSALAMVAALLGTGQVEAVAQGVEQGRPGRDIDLSLDSVDDQRDRNLGRHRNGCRGGPRRLARPRHLCSPQT